MPLVPYADTCAALKHIADFLRLPWSTVATALVFLHRFKSHPQSSHLASDVCAERPIWSLAILFMDACFLVSGFPFDAQDIISSCLFLAAKVEEVRDLGCLL